MAVTQIAQLKTKVSPRLHGEICNVYAKYKHEYLQIMILCTIVKMNNITAKKFTNQNVKKGKIVIKID